MIVEPKKYDYIYTVPSLEKIEKVMFNAVKNTGCSNLFLSGGVDSSLALHFLSQCYPLVKCFTLAKSIDHPDYFFASMIAKKYAAEHHIYIPEEGEIENERKDDDLDGDAGIRLLSKYTLNYVDSVVVTDGIDELDCGYYPHQDKPDDKTFRKFITDLEELHLKPLDRNTGTLKIYAPYLTKNVVDIFMKLSMDSKVDSITRKKHIMSIGIKYLPEELVYRRKYGFCSALKDIK
uniref:Putative asparagine synthase n=1 Tax=viral metagenome TaxID=1070528 RepID=A0A6M3Y0N1_9ZZZZ